MPSPGLHRSLALPLGMAVVFVNTSAHRLSAVQFAAPTVKGTAAGRLRRSRPWVGGRIAPYGDPPGWLDSVTTWMSAASRSGKDRGSQ